MAAEKYIEVWERDIRRVEAERDMARAEVARLSGTMRTAVLCIEEMAILMGSGARLEPEGLRVVSDRLRAALAATAKEEEDE